MAIYLVLALPLGSSGAVVRQGEQPLMADSLAAGGVYHHVPSPARESAERKLFTFRPPEAD